MSFKIRQIRAAHEVGFFAALLLGCLGITGWAAEWPGKEQGLQVSVSQGDGKYTIAIAGSKSYALRAEVGVEVDGRWLHASDYPSHTTVEESTARGNLGEATVWHVTYSGLAGQPDLKYDLRAYRMSPSAISR
jgi:alpha-galactosidase